VYNSKVPNGGWKEEVKGLFPAGIKTFFLPPEDVDGLGFTQHFIHGVPGIPFPGL